MSKTDQSREILWRAVALQVLEPDDLGASGSPVGDDALARVRESGVLMPRVEEALAALVERRPADGAIVPGGTAVPAGSLAGVTAQGTGLQHGTRTVVPGDGGTGLNVQSQTLSPARDARGPWNASANTASPERTASRTSEKDGPWSRGATSAPERGTKTGKTGDSVLNVDNQTFAPERDRRPKTGKTGDSVLNVANQTFAPDHESATGAPAADSGDTGHDTHATLKLDTLTVMPGRETAGETGLNTGSRTSAGDGLNVGRGTVAPSGGTVVRAGEPIDRSHLLDLSALETDQKQAITEAAFGRIAVRLGFTTWDVVEPLLAAGTGEVRFEDRLVQDGILDPAQAMEIFGLRDEARLACPFCCALVQKQDTKCGSCESALGSAPAGGVGATIIKRDAAENVDVALREGGTFAGYEIIERVAEGGMGVVFRARQTTLNRIVALKVMRGGSMASKARRRRFLQEAEAAAALQHPSIVPVHEIDESAGYPFYTMDFIEGPTLNTEVKQKNATPADVAGLMRQVADAVHHFHLHGIIHRDLKPDNILVGEDGRPKIIDFGIAKKLGTEGESGTIEGDVLGTPHYMSPEQAAGRVSEVDVRTDVYALGAIGYELLTGAPPWKGLPSARLVVAIQEDDPPPIRTTRPDVESDLEAIVMKCMAKERERRYQSASELALDLERFLKHEPVQAQPASLTYRLKKVVRRRLPAVIATTVVLVTVGSMGGYTVLKSMQKTAEERQLVAKAREAMSAEQLPAAEDLLRRVLGMNEQNIEAKSALEVLVQRRDTADKVQKAKDEEEKKRLADRIAAQEAQAKLKDATEKERIRVESEKQAASEAERRGRELFERSKGEKDPMRAIGHLTPALLLLPPGGSALRTEIGTRKFDLGIALARAAVKDNQTAFAEYWLREIGSLDEAAPRKAEITQITADIGKLKSGERDLEAARNFIKTSRWLEARRKLEQAKAQGVAAAEVDKELSIVESRCAERAKELILGAQDLLRKNEPTAALARATEARLYEPESVPARDLVTSCENGIARTAQRDAALMFSRPEERQRALGVLEQAWRTIQDPALVSLLRREHAARARLLKDDTLVLVPETPELGLRMLLIERTEVSNAAFKKFVDAKGYETPDLWDEAARSKLASFRDGCPGGRCAHRGPRTWLDGGFGDQANAERPVRGVTHHEARAFARWRSRDTKARWRLPQQREWEAGAGLDPANGAITTYPWGDTFDPGAIATGTAFPRTVGSTPRDRSPLGMLDAGGNVLEWVERENAAPGLKGADFAAHVPFARHGAQVKMTGTPAPEVPAELLARVGFRLVLEIEVDK